MQKRYALVVGVDTYPEAALSKCANDAKAVGSVLKSREFGFQVTDLINEQVTRRRLAEYINLLFREEAGFYLLYFSGHGWSTDLGVHLVTTDADEIDQGVSLDTIRQLITNVAPPKASVLVILDCCHAGAGLPYSLPDSGTYIRPEDVAQSITHLPEGRVLLAACRANEFSYEDKDSPNSIFTRSLLAGLNGDAADVSGEITISGLFDFVARHMQQEARTQTPVFKGDIAGRIVLGTGFPPKLHPAPDEQRLKEIVAEAEKHLSDYQSRIAASYADLDGWRNGGHRAACQILSPVLEWFEKTGLKYPDLARDQKFSNSRLALFNRLGSLCSIDVGMETVAGHVLAKVGSGTFGTVWRVRQSGGSIGAFKVYHAQDISVQEKMRRFRRGFSAMAQLDHPHIVKVHRYTEAPPGFIMDFIEGANLREFTGALDEPRDVIALLLTIGETLKHAHNRGVVHRDVKPENIIISPDSSGKWRAYLTDFDLAWFSTASQFTKEGLGTWQYSAPEQLANPGSASAHAVTTDSYSFGQLAYYAITGSDPIPLEVADNQSHLEKTVRAGWYADPAQLFLELYSKCTSRRPEVRPNFESICLVLSKVLQQLGDLNESSVLSPERFTRELVFSMVGASIEGESFVSLSGKTQIRVSLKRPRHDHASLDLEFHALVEPILDGISNEQMRRVLNERIDRALNALGNTTRQRGSVGPYSITVHKEQVPLSLTGLYESRLLISRVVDAIEGR